MITLFRQAEDEYFKLRGQFEVKRITLEQFENALKNLMAQDAQGRHWIPGTNTAKWYVHDGRIWMEANLPVAAAEPAVTPSPARESAKPADVAESAAKLSPQPATADPKKAQAGPGSSLLSQSLRFACCALPAWSSSLVG